MEDRFQREATAEAADKLRAAVYILMGLRDPLAVTESLFAGVRSMEDSVTYQHIIAKGVAKGIVQGELVEAKKLLLRLGRKRFGLPDPETQAEIDRLTDLDRLEQ